MSETDTIAGDDQSNYETPATPSEEAGTPSGPELTDRIVCAIRIEGG